MVSPGPVELLIVGVLCFGGLGAFVAVVVVAVAASRKSRGSSAAGMPCPGCGRLVSATNNYCAGCGQPMGKASPPAGDERH